MLAQKVIIDGAPFILTLPLMREHADGFSHGVLTNSDGLGCRGRVPVAVSAGWRCSIEKLGSLLPWDYTGKGLAIQYNQYPQAL